MVEFLIVAVLMTLKSVAGFLLLCSLVLCLILVWIAWRTTPADYLGWRMGVPLFVLFVFLLSTGTSIGMLWRHWFDPSALPLRSAVRALRQAAICSVLILVLLFLAHIGSLRIWVVLLLCLGSSLLEAFFLTKPNRLA